MEKARQAHFDAEILDGQFRASFYGTEDDVALCVEQGMEELIERRPAMRKKLRKAARSAMWSTAPDWIQYLLRGWPLSLAGAALLYFALCGFSRVCGLIWGVL